MKSFKISGHPVGSDEKPFIIAEMSGNHNNSLEKALQIVAAVANAGADAIKLQTYTADTMTINIDSDDFKISDPNSLWYGQNLYQLYEDAHTPWDWHKAIFDRAKELGIICFSTPFDVTAVDFLETLDTPAYKIASFENTDIQLIRKVCSTGKPVIVSTGLASLEELQLIVNTLRESGCEKFVLLRCTSAYPASPEDANVRTIQHMAEMFDCQIGLSDHTMGIGTSLAAIALGATVIEKHFCLSREEGGVDSAFSLEPHELKLLVEESKRAWQALGKVKYQISKIEEKSKQFRRSIYFVKDMKAGGTIAEHNIRIIRPGYGLAPKYWNEIIGKKIKRDVKEGDHVSWDVIG